MSRVSSVKLRQRDARLHRYLVGAAGALCGVIVLGALGYMLIEGWPFRQALFFTVITITTVGYGDYGLSARGELFTLFVMTGGIGVFTYAMTQVFPYFFNSQRIQERQMYKQIMQLSDHYIVCGLGRIGRTVCSRLAEQETMFVAIDQDQEAVRWATAEGFLAIVGDATEDTVLEEVNVHAARGLAAVAKDDTANIVITLGGRDLNPELFIISRAEHGDATSKLQRAGASLVISPTRTGGDFIAQTLRNPDLAVFYQHAVSSLGDFGLVEVKVEPGAALEGAAIEDLHRRFEEAVFVALRDRAGNTALRPHNGEVLRCGDSLIVAGRPENLAPLHRAAQTTRHAA